MIRTWIFIGVVSLTSVVILCTIYNLVTTIKVEDLHNTGHLMIHKILNESPPLNRVKKLKQLKPYLASQVELLNSDQLGDLKIKWSNKKYFLQKSYLPRIFLFTKFSDQTGGLKIGPIPRLRTITLRQIPIGLIMGIIFIIGVISWMTWHFTKIKKISLAMGEGNLSARIPQTKGLAQEVVSTFNQMASRVEMMVKERDEFIQAISHELGTPLSRLRIQLNLLGESTSNFSDSKYTERIESMYQQLDELNGLIEDALMVVESNEAPLLLQKVDIIQVIKHLIEWVTLDEPGTQLSVSLVISDKVPQNLSLVVDSKLFARMVDNVLRNACRYAASRIEVRVMMSGEYLMISVEDDGPGIPVESREKVVQPFVRIESHRGRESGGAGLGLAIVDRIVQRHQGQLIITDSSLQGACIQTFWPYV